MKATVDVPDELYRQVTAKSTLEERPVREVAVELFQGYVGRGEAAGSAPRTASGDNFLADGKPAPPWFELARKHVRKVDDHGLDAGVRADAELTMPEAFLADVLWACRPLPC